MGKNKRGACMADGGIVETPEQLRKRIAEKYGVGSGDQAPTPPVAAPATSQKPQPQQVPEKPSSMLSGLKGILSGRSAQIDKAAGYARGGIVRGKGTPTSDDVPMTVNGKGVNLSDTEAVLPHATVMALGGPEAVEQLIEETNGKPPVKGGLREGGSYYRGAVDDERTVETLHNGLYTSDGTSISSIADSFKNWQANKIADTNARIDAGMGKVPAAAAENPLVAGAQFAKKDPFGPEKRMSVPGDTTAGGGFITGAKPGDMPDSAQGGFTQDGKSYNVNQTSQPGVSRVTAPGTSPLYTNIKPEDAVAGLKNQMIGGDEASVKEGIDRQARANKARGEMINNMIAANGGNGIAVLPDSTQSAASSEIQIPPGMKSPRRVAEFIKGMAAIKAQERGQEIQADTAALQNQTARYGYDINAQRAAGHDAVIARGQDLTAANDAERNRIMEEQASRKGILAPIAVSGGEVANPNDPFGVAKIKLPNAVFDPNTGKWHTQPQANEKAATTKEEVQAALATGKISRDEIKKRLTSAGLNPNDYL